jgi:hypothetical protein
MEMASRQGHFLLGFRLAAAAHFETLRKWLRPGSHAVDKGNKWSTLVPVIFLSTLKSRGLRVLSFDPNPAVVWWHGRD